MAKRVLRPIQVSLQRRESGGTLPAAFAWRGSLYRVHRVEAAWKEVGKWWDGEGERTTYRVTAAPEAAASPWGGGGVRHAGRPRRPGQPVGAPGVYELCYRHETGEWFLAEIQD